MCSTISFLCTYSLDSQTSKSRPSIFRGKGKKAHSYLTQYLVHGTVQITLHFTPGRPVYTSPLADLFTLHPWQTCLHFTPGKPVHSNTNSTSLGTGFKTGFSGLRIQYSNVTPPRPQPPRKGFSGWFMYIPGTS